MSTCPISAHGLAREGGTSCKIIIIDLSAPSELLEVIRRCELACR